MFGLFSSRDFVRVFRLEVLFCGMQDGTFLVQNPIQNDRNAIQGQFKKYIGPYPSYTWKLAATTIQAAGKSTKMPRFVSQ